MTVLAIDDENSFMPDFFQEVSYSMIQLDKFNNVFDDLGRADHCFNEGNKGERRASKKRA